MGNCGAKKRRQQQYAAAAAASNRVGTATLPEISGNSGDDLQGAFSSGYGGGGGYVYAMMCPEGIDQDIALLATSAALAVGIYVVYRSVKNCCQNIPGFPVLI